ncbi:MAG TPA: ABC transporter permease [Blastocatellia bacterium]|jgi:predicted permease|nr:ABC transporter permease [Blastocatellia bacterium]
MKMMDKLSQLWRRLLFYARRDRFDGELEEEMRFHLELKAQENAEAGMGPLEARYAARRQFGNQTLLQEVSRDMWGVRSIETLFQDLRYGARMLLKNPGFALIAVLTLALGIGANTAIFSVINGVLLKPLPYREPDRIFQVLRRYPQGMGDASSATKFSFYRQHNQTFEGLAACDILGAGVNLLTGDEAHFVSSLQVSADLFPVLGINPLLGRTFTAAEDQPGAARVIVISHSLWKRVFNGDRQIVGKTVSLGSEGHTVVGVMPPGFQTRPSAEIWIPLRAVFDATDKGNNYLMLGRIKPGVTQEQAQADLERVRTLLRKDYPDHVGDDETAAVVRYQDRLVGDTKRPLLLLLGAVGFVLLIACANVTNLLLSRAAARSKEMSVRAALGAGRFRVARQLLTESLLLAGAGAALGLLLAQFGLKSLIDLAPDSLPRESDIGIDPRVLMFTLGISAAAGILLGLAPALDAGRLNLTNALREGSGRTTGAASRARLRNLLVGAEIALSVVLLIGAALLMRTFANLRNENLGFDPKNVLTLKLSMTDPRYQSTAGSERFFRQVFERLRQIQGVESVAYITTLPTELCPGLPFRIEGRRENALGESNYKHITPDYFRTMAIPLRQGRLFEERDGENAAGVVIINETFARQFFPNENPIGQHLMIGGNIGLDYSDRPREIVGVAGDLREEGVDVPLAPMMFIPLAQRSDRLTLLTNKLAPASLVVKTRQDLSSKEPAVRAAVRAADPTQAVSNLRTMEDVLSQSLAQQQFDMLLLAVFAGLALLLSAIGIYGVMSYSVSQRTHEIGIRLALGAQTADVLGMIIRQGMGLVLAGVGIGVAGALALTRLMKTLLFGVSATDPLTFTVIALLLAFVALLACWIPARRATKVDPITALRFE